MYSPPQGFFLRIKVEDSQIVDVLGRKVRTPVPTPNRDDFKEGHRDFTTLMELKYRLILFKRDFSKFLHNSLIDSSVKLSLFSYPSAVTTISNTPVATSPLGTSVFLMC